MPTISMGKSPKPEQSKSFTPTAAGSVITPDAGYTLSQVTVDGDVNLVSTNIKSGVNIFGVAGDQFVVNTVAASATPDQILSGANAYAGGMNIVGTIPSKTAQTYTPGTSNQTISAEQYLSGAQTIAGDADLVAGNIKSGVNIFGVAGTFTSDATAVAGNILNGKTAYVNGSKITGTFPVYTAGTHIIAYSDKIKSSYGSSYQKVKEITIKSAGVYRIYFTLKNTIYFEVYGRIYKNGVAYGTQRSIIPPFGEIVGQEFTQDLSFAANDLVQIYVRTNGDSYAYVTNFRIGVSEIINIPVVNDFYN